MLFGVRIFPELGLPMYHTPTVVLSCFLQSHCAMSPGETVYTTPHTHPPSLYTQAPTPSCHTATSEQGFGLHTRKESLSLDSERVDLGRIWCLTLAHEYLARCNHLSHGFNSIQQTFIEHLSASRFLSVL